MQLEWGGPADDDLIDMAFSKKRSADRREWMREATRREQVASETGSERSALGAQRLPQRRSYKDFVQDELVHFSLADVRRHLPSPAAQGVRTLLLTLALPVALARYAARCPRRSTA